MRKICSVCLVMHHGVKYIVGCGMKCCEFAGRLASATNGASSSDIGGISVVSNSSQKCPFFGHGSGSSALSSAAERARCPVDHGGAGAGAADSANPVVTGRGRCPVDHSRAGAATSANPVISLAPGAQAPPEQLASPAAGDRGNASTAQAVVGAVGSSATGEIYGHSNAAQCPHAGGAALSSSAVGAGASALADAAGASDSGDGTGSPSKKRRMVRM